MFIKTNIDANEGVLITGLTAYRRYFSFFGCWPLEVDNENPSYIPDTNCKGTYEDMVDSYPDNFGISYHLSDQNNTEVPGYTYHITLLVNLFRQTTQGSKPQFEFEDIEYNKKILEDELIRDIEEEYCRLGLPCDSAQEICNKFLTKNEAVLNKITDSWTRNLDEGSYYMLFLFMLFWLQAAEDAEITVESAEFIRHEMECASKFYQEKKREYNTQQQKFKQAQESNRIAGTGNDLHASELCPDGNSCSLLLDDLYIKSSTILFVNDREIPLTAELFGTPIMRRLGPGHCIYGRLVKGNVLGFLPAFHVSEDLLFLPKAVDAAHNAGSKVLLCCRTDGQVLQEFEFEEEILSWSYASSLGLFVIDRTGKLHICHGSLPVPDDDDSKYLSVSTMVNDYCFLRKDGSILSSWKDAESINGAVRVRCGVNSLAVLCEDRTCKLLYRNSSGTFQKVITPLDNEEPVDFCSCSDHSILLFRTGKVQIDDSAPQNLPPASAIAAGTKGFYTVCDGTLRFLAFGSQEWVIEQQGIPDGTEIEAYGDSVYTNPCSRL